MNVIVKYDIPDNLTVNVVEGHSTVINILPRSPIIVNICDGTGGFISDYANLAGKPRINNVELNGNKTLNELGIEPKRGANDFYVTDAEKTQGALATGNSELKTVKEVADKAQFAPSENGTILYHTAKWFTPTGTISTVGTTATSTSAQFTSAMVGAKLTISGEERIIVSYVSGTQVVVNSAYSQNYNSITHVNYGVYSIAIIISQSQIIIKNITGNNMFIVGSTFISNVNQLFNYSNINLLYDSKLRWSGINDPFATKDCGISRNSAGVLEINDGNNAGLYRDLSLKNLNYSGALNFTSDARLKTNVRPVSEALKKCCDIASTIRHFEYKDQDGYFKGLRTSPIAQLLIDKGLGGFVSYRDPKDETEGVIVGWTYKDETYEEKNAETDEIEVKTRRVPDRIGDQVMQVDNNFTPFALLGIAELAKENEMLKTRLENIEKRLGL